uniref:COP9 signalosome complex subunit 5 n=1 Tax=Rhizochromulina marina TaxID=1034831 RepID=A0A7S2WTE4_9STRA|mmetsp:Transcript_4071/g.11944  ORF Transcript_4071/g.11944 Transcript_4071/m.11944 type:complete len:374 (+) Transcript_4071:109-1230(+)
MASPAAGGGAGAPDAMVEDGPGAMSAAQKVAAADDSWYSVDEAKLASTRESKPWMGDAKYFKKVKVGPSAAMKMLMHTYSGVEKGIKESGKPVEVMGLLLGRPHTEDLTTLVVTDAFPLPVEGFETRVIADDESVVNYMITLGETIESTRKERFMGWYHSHPFDVDEEYSHCYMSNTDITTQLAWQRAEDPHGNPWLAIVVDPLRSLAKSHPEFGAFRTYPPEFEAGRNETPDGSNVVDDQKRVEKWGVCWNRYYKLDIEYFMSAQAKAVIAILSKNFLWMRTLGSTPMLERENRERLSERVNNVATGLSKAEPRSGIGSPLAIGGLRGSRSGAAEDAGESSTSRPTQSAQGLASELAEGQMTQIAKTVLFGS